MFIPLQGFAPDAEPTAAGAVLDGVNVIPTLRGMRAGPSAVTTGLPALAAACRGVHIHQDLDGTFRFYAGTQTALYQDASTTWTDRSAGGGYTGSSTSRWRFASFGAYIVAANYVDATQVATTAAFAALAGAPKAAIVESAELFVFAFNTSDGTYGTTQYDRWWCCARGDHTDWTPAVATGSATGRLIDGAGPITGAKRLGSQIVAYKEQATYIGTYVGGNEIWNWQRLPGNAGALNHECIALIQDGDTPAQVFIGKDDIWFFDGSRPMSIGAPLREWLFADLDMALAYKICSAVDQHNARVWWFYPGRGGAGAINRSICWNWKSRRWGIGTGETIEFAGTYQAAGVTWGGLGALYSTWQDFPDAPYDTAFLPSTVHVPCRFDTSHLLATLTGTPATSRLVLNDIGTDDAISYVHRVRPRFVSGSPTGTLYHYYRDGMGDAWTQGATSTMGSKRFDFGWSARWHRLQMDFSGAWEMSGAEVSVAPEAEE